MRESRNSLEDYPDQNYVSYEKAVVDLDLDTLDDRDTNFAMC